jgi:hypothetical protein
VAKAARLVLKTQRNFSMAAEDLLETVRRGYSWLLLGCCGPFGGLDEAAEMGREEAPFIYVARASRKVCICVQCPKEGKYHIRKLLVLLKSCIQFLSLR